MTPVGRILLDDICRFVAEQDFCNILQGAFLLQGAHKADRIQEGNHFFCLLGIPHMNCGYIAKFTAFVLGNHRKMRIHLRNHRVGIWVFKGNNGDVALFVGAADMLHQLTVF